MIDRILVPIDGSAQAEEACELVFEEFPDATLVLLHVINPAEASYGAQASIPSFSEEWYREEKRRAEELFEDIEQQASDHGIEVEHTVEVGKPPHAIAAFAEEHDIDHIVMGSHGREGVSRILLGSVAETVMRRSPVPVTVVR
ncbi:universal stress protein [Salinibaculum rarum]|uniref:universal stress protein n=1 Tax=Salinibaculum rarum TaxID=3058903 RepID=UPI0026604986|nr:universal stress protein [Salinibaculum sp. KK48]